MVKIISFEEISKENLRGIFVYPTDTIYGIGCDAMNSKLVEKIRKIKNRDKKPFSIIAPSKKWILENCEVNEEVIEKYLPGKYTLVLKSKYPENFKHISSNGYLGIRIPKHRISSIVESAGFPIITTSVNISGREFIKNPEKIPNEIKDNVDFIFDQGIINGTPSVLVVDGKEVSR